MKKILVIFLLLCLAVAAQAQYQLNGDAAQISPTCFRLTNNATNNAGSVWYTTLVDLSKPFDLYLNINLGCSDAGADGMALVFQPVSTGVGSSGSGLGYQFITPSLAVEFDTYQNGNNSDPVADHMAMMTNGVNDHATANNIAGPVSISATGANVEDCQAHTLRVRWNPTTQVMDVYVDCSLRLTYTGNIVASIFNNNPLVYWGFTAATGAAFNQHRFCIDYVSFTQAMKDSTVCKGTPVQLNAGIGQSYAWTPSAGLSDSTIVNPITTPTVTTTYSVTVIDACNMPRTDDVKITVIDTLAMSGILGKDTTICSGSVLALNATNPNALTYGWSTGATSPVISASAVGTYWVEATNLCGAQRDSIAITHFAPMSISLGNDTVLCPGQSLAFDATQPATVGTTLIGWLVLPFGVPIVGNTYTAQQPGGQIAVSVANSCAIIRDTIAVSYLAVPTVSLGKDTILCTGNAITLNAFSATASSYTWSTGATTPTISVNTIATVHVAAANKCGTARDTIKIGQLAPPIKPTFGKDTTLCVGLVKPLTVAQPTATSYSWSTGATTPNITANVAGLFWGEAQNRCGVARDSIQIDYLKSPKVNLGRDSAVCGNASRLLDATSPSATYLWHDGSTAPTFNVTFPDADTSIKVYVTATNRCGKSSDTCRYTILPIPAPFSLGKDTTLCVGQRITLKHKQRGVSNGWNPNSAADSIVVEKAGVYSLNARNRCGSEKAQIKVSYEDIPPMLNLPDTLMVCEGDSVMLSAAPTGSVPFQRYQWNTGDTLPTQTVFEAGTYSVTTTNHCGIRQDTARIGFQLCRCDIYAANAFTPNGDSHNELFLPLSFCEIRTWKFSVFDRWGSLIFESTDPAAGWDGTKSSTTCPEGVYAWTIAADVIVAGKPQTRSVVGTVTLIR